MNFLDYLNESDKDIDDTLNESKYDNVLSKDMIISTYKWNVDNMAIVKKIKLYFNNMSQGALTAKKVSSTKGDTQLLITLLFVEDELDVEDYLDIVGSFGEDCKKLYGADVTVSNGSKKSVDAKWSERVITCTFD